jgi:hypothetical protein
LQQTETTDADNSQKFDSRSTLGLTVFFALSRTSFVTHIIKDENEGNNNTYEDLSLMPIEAKNDESNPTYDLLPIEAANSRLYSPPPIQEE